MNDKAGSTFEDVDAIRETDRALLVRLKDDREVWVPKSQIHDDSEVYDLEDGKSGSLVVKQWFIDKTGWPDE